MAMDKEELTHEELVDELRKRCREAGSAGKWARANGLNASYLSLIFSGAAKIGPGVAEGLGYERVQAKWRKKQVEGPE